MDFPSQCTYLTDGACTMLTLTLTLMLDERLNLRSDQYRVRRSGNLFRVRQSGGYDVVHRIQ